MILSPDFIAYEQKCAAVSALRADALPLNKSTLFDALADAEIRTVSSNSTGQATQDSWKT
jgi:hypothetical protein